SFADRHARRACVAGLAVLCARAVDRFRDQASDGRLAGATRARQQVCMRDLARGDGVAERPRDVLLTDDLAETLRAPAPVEGGTVGHGPRIAAARSVRGSV